MVKERQSKSSRKVKKDVSKVDEKKESKRIFIKDLSLRKILHSSIFWFFLLLIISLWANWHVRTYFVDLRNVEENIKFRMPYLVKESIRQELLSKYVIRPSDSDLEKMVNEIYKQRIKDPNYEKQIKLEMEDIVEKQKSEFLNEKGEPLMGDIDSFFFYRRYKNIIEKGHVCDEIINGTCYDTLMLAPYGTPTSPDFYTSVTAFLYKNFVKPFSDMSDYMFFLYAPAIYMLITAVVAFLIGYFFFDLKSGFLFSLLLGLNTFVLSRSMGGAPDNDAPNFFFSLLVVLFAYLAYKNRKNLKYLIFYSFLFGLSIYLFSLQWIGWWYIFDIVLIAIAFNILFVAVHRYLITRKIKSVFSSLKLEFLYLLVLLVFSSIFLSFQKATILDPIRSAFFATTQLKGVGYSIWPNVHTTVAELKPGSLDDVFYALYNEYYFSIFSNNPSLAKMYSFIYIALLIFGIFTLLFISFRDPEKDYHFISILCVIWIGVMGYATLKGIRFNIYVVPPYALIVSIGISYLINFLNKILFSQKKDYYVYFRVISSALIILFLIYPIWSNSNFLAINHLPMYTGGWDRAMKYIRENTSEDAIIDSWWDFGHWFKAMANRRVTFDGASQNTPMAHWMGKALLTDDYVLSVKILRMLACGSNRAFDSIDKKLNDSYRSIVLLYELLNLSKDQAKQKLLDNNFSESEANEVINYIYCDNPPEKIFITSEDMVAKAGVWAHFGEWDFFRAKLWSELRTKNYNEAKNILINTYNLSMSEAAKIAAEIEQIKRSADVDEAANTWISPWPSYLGNVYSCRRLNQTLECPLNLAFNDANNNRILIRSFVLDLLSNNETAYYNSQILMQRGSSDIKLYPKRVYLGNDQTLFFDDKNTIDFGVIVLGDRIILADYRLVNSVFTRLFYFEESQKYFEKLYKDFAVGTGKVIVWRVNYSAVD
ncbi:MAG: STT3 domain-containing protein [Candidatus Woesearchaeota archaeon]